MKNFFDRFRQFEAGKAEEEREALIDELPVAEIPLTLPERDLGPFPFHVLWDEDRATGSVLRFVPLINAVLLLIILVIVIAK